MLREVVRDIGGLTFGAWILYKEVYAKSPSWFLALIGFGCMFPAARAAIISILSSAGSSFSSAPSERELPQQSSSEDKDAKA
jgi:hypothetical protein